MDAGRVPAPEFSLWRPCTPFLRLAPAAREQPGFRVEDLGILGAGVTAEPNNLGSGFRV